MIKRKMDIEALLRWVYRDELPRAQSDVLSFGPRAYATANGAIRQAGEMMTVIDAPLNRYGVVADLTAMRPPHPDAIKVYEAVTTLDSLVLEFPDGWDPFADIPCMGVDGIAAGTRAIQHLAVTDERGLMTLRGLPATLVRRYAILNGTPDWYAEAPVRKTVTVGKGRPGWFRRVLISGAEMEVDGFDRKRRMPYPDAYQKSYLDPDPFEFALGRAEYEVWHAALGVLAADLDGQLQAFDVCESHRPSRPWEAGNTAPPRILRDLRGSDFPMESRRVQIGERKTV